MFPAITITAVTDTAGLNELVKTPEIWAALSDDSKPEPIELTLAAEEFLLEAALDGKRIGYFYLVPSNLGYTVHTIFGPEHRGALALAAAKAAQKFAFCELGIEYLWSYVLGNNPKAGVFAQLAGFRKVGEQEHPATVNGVKVMCVYYERSKLSWILEYACANR